MTAFATRIVLVFALLFGSVIAPAIASADSAVAIEALDIGCHTSEIEGSADESKPDSEPAGHIDHHHCAAYVALIGNTKSSQSLVSDQLFFAGRDAIFASRSTAPPTQPPAA